ncbi:MAG: Veg protein [Clostridia bacterium]|nr:Veg protein [Clostridia bacterium]NLF21132.1 Veg protein [Clostridiaceae bacterium]
MIIKSELEMCKRDMEACVGRKVRLKSNGGRKRTIIREGIVENCYPNVFTVRCIRTNHDDPEMVSYSYVDILTDTVEVAVAPDNQGETLTVS